jgi:hypothetical protein
MTAIDVTNTRPENTLTPLKTRFGFPRQARLAPSISVFLQRFRFKSAAVRSPSPGLGIVSVTAYKPGQPPLVLLMDLQSINDGASLTNSADAAVHHVAHTAFQPLGADYRTATWVQVDSEGAFDLMISRWPMDKPLQGPQLSHPSVSWRPLRHNDRARTLDAFLGAFPEIGSAVWDEATIVLKSLQAASPAFLPKD